MKTDFFNKYKLIFSNLGVEVVTKSGSVVFDIAFDFGEDNIDTEILNECNNHIELIDARDKDYFNKCDEDYLTTEWKNIVNEIKSYCEVQNEKI